ncbi:ABC transporter ATP-binding protein [Lacihabitans soyangensis]|uniref:ABC transporter ATP-binding protein n=1 Tax=Lacihabitans soyangensis TaxID=869394 RepID=A0AAE3GYI4_9BACT|nr:ABC transporter ATP-binding protein [Lacihabitans soyangensis]MCP9761382.1 ABC transporter ATP-binding protein [Lacihabitans soyangensis]
MKAEKTEKKIVDYQILKRLFGFLLPYKSKFTLLVFLIIIGALLAPALPLMIQTTIDGPIASGNYGQLALYLGIMVLILVLNSVVSYYNTYEAGWLSQQIIHDIRQQVFQKIIHLKLKYYDQTPIGKLVTRTISDVESLSEVFSSGFAAIAGDFLQLILIISVMFYLDWKLTLISISTIPLLLISTYVFKEKVKKSFNQVRNAVANLNSFVQERISGMSLIQIFNVQKQEFDKFNSLNLEHRNANIKSILYYSVYFPVADVISALGVGLIVWYGAQGLINHEVSYGTITAFIMFINQFFRPIRMIADRINTLQMGVVSVSRIIEILDDQENIEPELVEKREIKGEVAFKNVWFAYIEEQWVLKNLSFEAKIGESVAFVGATGAGKTSIISLLNGFYAINRGEILVDGQNINKWNLENLRSQIGVVLQDVFLFKGSIAENLRMGDQKITDEMIVNAAKEVGVHEFICRLPGQYAYEVMERGATISMGQRQLLSFVRVLLQNPKIIILDEATSSIDSESEELIQNAIEKLMKNRTSIVIAHRLSTIQKADKIILLEKGQIMEVGTHQKLLTMNGLYTKLYEIQFEKAL